MISVTVGRVAIDVPQVPVGEIAQVVHVLHVPRPVETVRVTQLCVDLGRQRLLAGLHLDRVAREDGRDEEEDQRHPEEDRDELDDPPSYVLEHAASSLSGALRGGDRTPSGVLSPPWSAIG